MGGVRVTGPGSTTGDGERAHGSGAARPVGRASGQRAKERGTRAGCAPGPGFAVFRHGRGGVA